MALQIEQQTRDFGLVRTPLGPERTRVIVRPGDTIRFVDDSGQPPARAPGIRVRRLDNNLIIDGLPDGRVVELNNFFGACRPGAECRVSLADIGPPGAAAITEATPPAAALADGSFLLYAGRPDAVAASALPAAQVTGPAGPSWLAIAGGAAGIGIAAAAAGGGGSGGSGGPVLDTTPPGAPVITSGAVLRGSAAVLTGEAEAGSRVTVRVDVNGNGSFTESADLTFVTTAAADGRWQVDLNGTPQSGTPPAGGLRDGSYTILAVATDAALNASPATRSFVTIDGTAPASPVIGAVAGDDVVNGAERQTGVIVSGSAEAGTTVTVTWGGSTVSANTDPAGRFAATFSAQQIPADGNTAIQAVATDPAGNSGATASRAVAVDTTAPAAPLVTSPLLTNQPAPTISGTAEPSAAITLRIDRNNDGSFESAFTTVASTSGVWTVVTTPAALGGALPDNSQHGLQVSATDSAGNTSPPLSPQPVIGIDYDLPPAATIVSVSGTNPSAGDTSINAAEEAAGVTISGSIGAIYAGRPVDVTWGAITKPATVTGTSWTVGFLPTEVPADGQTTISARYTSVNGTPSVPATRDVTVDTVAPAAPAAPTVPEGAGGLNASEASDGTAVSVSLSGTGAAAGDVLTVNWGARAVTRTLTGPDVTAGTVSVTVPAATITQQGDGTVSVTASLRDAAGNAGPASPATAVLVDASPPAQTVTSFVVTDDVAPVTGAIVNGGTTNDARPVISIALSGPLLAGETLSLSRAGGTTPVATFGPGAPLTFTEPGPLAEGPNGYTASISDAAGNTTVLDRNGGAGGTTFSFTVDTIAPTQTATLVSCLSTFRGTPASASGIGSNPWTSGASKPSWSAWPASTLERSAH